MVADTREIFHPAAADSHDRVFLEVVADAGDVGSYLHPISQTHPGDLAQSRVGFLGSSRGYFQADPSLLGRPPVETDVPGFQRIKSRL